MSSASFKIYNPIEDVIAQVSAGGGGGGGVPSTGGTFTGNVVMAPPAKISQDAPPSAPSDLVNLAYLQATYLPLSGGTMSGQISQPLAPVAGSDLANKAYVDTKFSTPGSIPGTVIVPGTLPALALAPGAAAANINAGPAGSINQSQIAGGPFLPLAGGTMTGPISQPTAPVNPNDLTNKAYVDSVVATAVPDATTSVKGKVQLAGDLSGTAAAPVVAPLAITNAKMANLGGPSQLKGSSSTSANATDISLGSSLVVNGTTLDVNPATLNAFLPLAGGTMTGQIKQALAPAANDDLANKAYVDSVVATAVPDATASVKGKVQLAGDLSGTAAAPVVAPLAITNAKMANLGGPSQLKGSGSTSANVVDITLDSSLVMVGNVLGVAPSIVVPDATTSVKGKIQLAGDFDPISTASAPIIGPNKITYPKIQQVSAASLLGNPTGLLTNAQEITLGSLSFSSNILNSPISFYGGTNPNITIPTDRPTSNSTIYMGTDNQLWVWNGLVYIPLTPTKFVGEAKSFTNQNMEIDDFVEFSPLSIIRPSTQGLNITDSSNGSVFTVDLDANTPSILLKITVSIGGLYTAGVIAKFFTYNITDTSFTGPGLILNNNGAVQITSTHMYSEIIYVASGSSTDFGVILRDIAGIPTIIDIGNGGGVPLTYRWILFEEI